VKAVGPRDGARCRRHARLGERHLHPHSHPRRRPPWWPASEAWPPAGDLPWQMRRRFLLRFALLAALVVLLMVAVSAWAVWSLLGVAGLASPGKTILAAAALVFVVAMLGLAGGGARRYATPLGDLIESASRVEAGDYTARVREPRHGPRELRALASAFNDMAARLEADERTRRTLLADVGHELRTPLAVLQGDLEAMLDGVHPADEAHLSGALEEIRMLSQLVEDLRTLSLAEAGTLTLHREPTDLAVLGQDVAAAFAGLARAAGVSVEVKMADELPLAELDPLRIRQVLSNLVSNALRYAPPGSAVQIAGERTDGGIAVTVVDQGPGIAPELLPHLFERFVKSPDSRGSGLGLAIARRLVEAHGGSIRASRPAGGGTAIRFELPA
jgi:two-component system sensor histidine kinase BaeS